MIGECTFQSVSMHALIILYDKYKLWPLRRQRVLDWLILGGVWRAFTIVPLDYRHLRFTDWSAHYRGEVIWL